MFFEIFEKLILLFLTPVCYEKVFFEFDFSDIGCFKYALSKGLGYGILLGSLMIKIPQIATILKHKSGEGISLLSESLMLIAVIGSMSYGYHKGFPISTYGDAYSMYLQTAVIIILILYYNKESSKILLLIGVLAIYSFLLFSNNLPAKVVEIVNGGQLILSLASKFIQAYTNYQNSSTGRLSPITLWLLFLGCVARIFTSVQETNDFTLILTYVLVSIANGLLVIQYHYYSKNTKKDSAKKTN